MTFAACAGPSNSEPDQAELAWIEQAVVSCAAGPTVKGVDVSVYQGNIDWNAVHAAGWEYAITRIGDGYGGDSTFVNNWAGIKNAGMIRGAYQFWRASNDQNRMADLVIAAVGKLGNGDLPVMLDIEGASMQGQSPAFIRAQMDLWLARVEAGTGKRPLIYTGKYAWDPSVQSTAYGQYVLWIAAYGANTGGVPSQCPNTPNGWNTWGFWQYSSVGSIPGINANVDKNLFNGDLAALRALADGVTDDNCLGSEAAACGAYGCGCVDHQCNGGFCPGSGCSTQHTANCGAYGSGCADGACNGGTSPGSGCTAKETLDCSHVGCGCVDHACNGGAACAGTGCTWRETHDCGGFGVNCADHQCSGGFGPGNGCTAKETNDCNATGCGCVDHACSGGTSCAGTGCTARQTLDCQNAGASCRLGACVTGSGTALVDAGQPPVVADAGSPVTVLDAGSATPEAVGTNVVTPPSDDLPMGAGAVPQNFAPAAPVQGGCAAVPGDFGLMALGLLSFWRRRAH
jgi:GH25 family lysozyme M1 (1,4-beta-N-acetylmuramidase)